MMGLFILVVVLLRLPPIYLLPSTSIFVMSHNIARFLIVLLFLFIYIKKKGSTIISRFNHVISISVLIWFISQSLSVVYARNIISFLSVYKETVFAILIFYISFYLINKNNTRWFMWILIIIALGTLLFELLTYLQPFLTKPYLQTFGYQKYLQSFNFALERDRYFGESFEEVLVPLIIILFITSKRFTHKVLLMLVLGMSVFVTLVSNWRTKTIMLAFAIVTTFLLFREKIRKYFILFVVILSLFLVGGNYLSLNLIGKNVYDRFLLTEEEQRPILARFNYWYEAINIGLSSPLFGVGLGNYYDNLTQKSKLSAQSSRVDRLHSYIFIDDPHNLLFSQFVTTGILGLGSAILLLVVFAFKDFSFISKGDINYQALVVSFWTLVLFGLFNPITSFAYVSFFWLLRGSIEKLRAAS